MLRTRHAYPPADPDRSRTRPIAAARPDTRPGVHRVVVVPVKELDARALATLRYAARLDHDHACAVHVTGDREEAMHFAGYWRALGLEALGLRLKVIECAPWAVAQVLTDNVRQFSAQRGADVAVMLSARHRSEPADDRSIVRQSLCTLAKAIDNLAVSEYHDPRRGRP